MNDFRYYVRPGTEQPGTLAQQLHAVLRFLQDRNDDRDAAWYLARSEAIPHALRADR